MAFKITEDCISCGACEPVCPTSSISEGESLFVIDPDKCCECTSFYDEQQCASVCPVDACVPDPDRRETKAQLTAKADKARAAKK